MQTKFLLFLCLVSISTAQRSKDDNIPSLDIGLPEIISRFVSNSSDNTVYFHAIPAELYYNDTVEPPLKDFKHLFNLTALSSEDIPIVLAFPYFPEENATTGQPSNDNNMTTDEMIGSETNFDLEAIPEVTQNESEVISRILRSAEQQNNGFNFFNPSTWFQRPITTTEAPEPPVINNYFIRPNGQGQSLQPQIQPLQQQMQSFQPQVKPLSMPMMFTPPPQTVAKISANTGNMANLSGMKVQTPIMANPIPQLQNVQYSGLAMNLPELSYPLVPATRIITDSQPKPEYPESDNTASVMEVVYS